MAYDARVCGSAVADVDHRAPFGEARAELVIFGQTLAQAVEPFGDRLARAMRQRLGAGIDLDAGNGAGRFDQRDQRRAVLGLLPDRFVVEDDAGNMTFIAPSVRNNISR